MGADSGVFLKKEGYFDSIATARALADEIKTQEADLVFLGKQSIDYDSGIVGQLLAELLGYNSVSGVVDLKIEGNNIRAEREIEGGREVVETTLPAIITAQKGLNGPRYASLKGIMQAKRRTVEVLKMKKPAPKAPGRILGSDASAVPELVRLLKEEAKVI